jgi:uncharacterized membrane protein YedE/YeeE
MPTEFTPISALIGGLLIGLAAAGMMLLSGRIAGISGIVARLLPPAERAGWTDRAAFLIGLVLAPLLWLLATGEGARQVVSSNLALMALAGLLVGFGSVLGGGCTSGHGVCGLARLSKRSFAAVAIFMGAAIATVFITRHIIGW